MSRLISAVKVAALIIGVLILGGVADLAYAEQRPGDCGHYINSNGQWTSGAESMRQLKD